MIAQELKPYFLGYSLGLTSNGECDDVNPFKKETLEYSAFENGYCKGFQKKHYSFINK